MFLPLPKPHVPKTAWFLGLDLAQRQDFTALATLQLTWSVAGHNKATWENEWTPSLIIRSLDRYELSQSYTAYQDAVEDRVNTVRAHASHSTHGTNVPRRALVSRTLLLMERGTLQAQPGVQNWTELCEELLRLRAGDSHSKAHDDLAIALTLAVWQATTHSPEILPQRAKRTQPITAGTRRLL